MHYIIKKRTMVKIILITALCSSLISIIATLLIIIYLRKRNKQKHGNNETNYNYIPNKTIIRQHNNKSSHTETAQIQRPKNTKKDNIIKKFVDIEIFIILSLHKSKINST